MRAVEAYRAISVKVLLDSDAANVDAVDKDGANALHHAAVLGHFNTVIRLPIHLQRIDVRTVRGRSATQLAKDNDHLAIQKRLEQYTAEHGQP